MAAHREATSDLYATWHSPIGPPQPCGSHHYTDLTCGSHQHATWQAMAEPPQHSHATWQHSSNTTQQIELFLVTHGSWPLVQLNSVGPTSDTWHSLTEPPQHRLIL
jgi:hypothetical protein